MIDLLHPEQRFTKVRGIVTEIPKKRGEKDKIKSEPKPVDGSTTELMQLDGSPAGPIGARFP